MGTPRHAIEAARPSRFPRRAGWFTPAALALHTVYQHPGPGAQLAEFSCRRAGAGFNIGRAPNRREGAVAFGLCPGLVSRQRYPEPALWSPLGADAAQYRTRGSPHYLGNVGRDELADGLRGRYQQRRTVADALRTDRAAPGTCLSHAVGGSGASR